MGCMPWGYRLSHGSFLPVMQQNTVIRKATINIGPPTITPTNSITTNIYPIMSAIVSMDAKLHYFCLFSTLLYSICICCEKS